MGVTRVNFHIYRLYRLKNHLLFVPKKATKRLFLDLHLSTENGFVSSSKI